jgi:N-acetylglucosaminyldiphosphoundecaprenol N-acetyl-beta-D-mannosaminyltransferase
MLPVLFNILKGDISFVGPRPVSPEEMSPADREVRRRSNVKPGIIGLWWLRSRTNIDYDSELTLDGEYVDTQSTWGDIALTLRAIPAVLYGAGVATAPDTLELLGIRINNLTMGEAISKIVEWTDSIEARQVCFVNTDCANIAYRDNDYLEILRSASLTLSDGIGMKLGGKLLSRELKQNVNGTDLFPRLCKTIAGTGKGIYLLGGKPGVADEVKYWIEKNHPGVVVKGTQHGYFDSESEDKIIKSVSSSGAEILLVAFGAPRQEKWISKNLSKLGVKVVLGVGGLFDFYSGRIKRAPVWVRELGMEWFFRFYQEPRRMWRRYFLGNFIFLYRIVKERVKNTP